MTNKLATAANIAVAVGAVAYLILALIHLDARQSTNLCRSVAVEITDDSPYRFVNDSIVHKWIEQSGVKVVGNTMNKIDVFSVEKALREHQFIDSVEVFHTMDGVFNIKIRQAIPILRVKTDYGYDFYVDSTAKILPLQQHFRAEVPIVTGYPVFGFNNTYYGDLSVKNEKDIEYLKKIINFVCYLTSDDFVRNLIVQIYINQSGDIELVPRVGNQIIVVGAPDDYKEKIDKLKKFYINSFSERWWDSAKVINLKYKQQVIVS